MVQWKEVTKREGDTIHVSCGDMDIRIHKKSPTMFDVVGNCRTGNAFDVFSRTREASLFVL